MGYTIQTIEKKSYNLELPDQSNICEIIEDQIEHYSYICDAISEQADSCVDIYNADLWKTAYDFQEWTEDAIDEGLCETSAMGGTDLIKIFMAGQYQYYTRMAYDNEKEMFFNIFVNYYDNAEEEDKEVLSKHFDVEEKLEELADDIDHDESGCVFRDNFDELIDEAKALEEEHQQNLKDG